MTHDPPRPGAHLSDHLRALAVDEAPVPADLAARAVAAARAAGQPRPGFLDELVVMARRGIVLGAATASVLAVLALGAPSSSSSSTGVTVAAADNPLVSWWDASLTTTTTTTLVLQ